MSDSPKNLAIAYAVKRRNMKYKGGVVSNEKLKPSHEPIQKDIVSEILKKRSPSVDLVQVESDEDPMFMEHHEEDQELDSYPDPGIEDKKKALMKKIMGFR